MSWSEWKFDLPIWKLLKWGSENWYWTYLQLKYSPRKSIKCVYQKSLDLLICCQLYIIVHYGVSKNPWPLWNRVIFLLFNCNFPWSCTLFSSFIVFSIYEPLKLASANQERLIKIISIQHAVNETSMNPKYFIGMYWTNRIFTDLLFMLHEIFLDKTYNICSH